MQKFISNAEFERQKSVAEPSVSGLLVTGGTGFIGGAVLAELLDSPLWRRTVILVRASTVDEGVARIARSLERFEPSIDGERAISREQVVLGGLEDAASFAADPRLASISHVIHSAAVTSFSKHPRIREINVEASLQFVKVLREKASLQRFLSVGTAWCVGLGKPRMVPEGEVAPSGEHIVPYTATKLEFERLVREQYPDVPFVSARPSIVVGHTRLGTDPSGSIYWVFRSGALLGRFTCKLEDRIDVVPVDWTAKALVQLAIKPVLRHSMYHLSAGSRAASTYGQLDEAIARGRDVAPHGPTSYRCVNDAQLVTSVYRERAKLGDVNPFLLSRALVLYGKFAASGTLFDNRRLLAEGIPLPPSFGSYADKCAATAERSSIAEQMEADFKC